MQSAAGKHLSMARSILALLLWALLPGSALASDWPVFGHDPGRSGDAGNQGLTPTNVAGLRVRWRISLPDVADSAPIVVGARLYQTLKNGTTVAVDVNHGRIVWSFATQGPKITTSVPAYDQADNALYVPGVDGYIHKLDPASGRELRGRGFPARITMAPETEKDASSLNLANGYLYAQTSGYFGDATPYVGHVVAIRLSDGSERVFNTLCSNQHKLIDPQSCPSQRSGMWSRSGVVVDEDPTMEGRIYVATGNGPFNASAGDYGDSILSLTSDASRLLSWYAPSDYANLEASDADLGSSSPALLPRQANSTTPLMAVQGGKDAALKLFDRTHLGGVGNALQTIDLGERLFGAPAVWTSPRHQVWVFIDLSDGVHAYTLATNGGKSRLESAWHADVASTYQGSSPVVSGGIVFVAGSNSLVALNAEHGRQLWSQTLGPIHWQSPVVANGAVYCSDQNGYLTAFGVQR